jgi:hypothetical protein
MLNSPFNRPQPNDVFVLPMGAGPADPQLRLCRIISSRGSDPLVLTSGNGNLKREGKGYHS